MSDTTGATVTDVQAEAIEVAGITEEDLGGLYAMCAAVNHLNTDPHPNAHTDGLTLEDAARINGALVLCPDHPNADALRATVAAAEQNAVAEEERQAGLRLDDGTYVVGEEVEAGIWVVDRSKEGCYWERTDSTGETIDNNFISGSTRVEVTIQPTDYSFHSNGCGEWHKVN